MWTSGKLNQKLRKIHSHCQICQMLLVASRGIGIFPLFDLLADYHQIPLDESSKEITAFSMGDQLYQYTRMQWSNK